MNDEKPFNEGLKLLLFTSKGLFFNNRSINIIIEQYILLKKMFLLVYLFTSKKKLLNQFLSVTLTCVISL